MNIQSQIQKANQAARKLAILSSDDKNKALKRVAELLIEQVNLILTENKKDMDEGKKKLYITNKIKKIVTEKLKPTRLDYVRSINCNFFQLFKDGNIDWEMLQKLVYSDCAL